MGCADGWCAIPGELLEQDGVIRLREPAHADREELARRLRDGAYDKPFVVDDDGMRRLHFDFRYVQGEMKLGEPYKLSFPYTRKMMAFLLFVPKPRHVLIVGLGAGSLTKFCYRHLPRSRITTVEIDADVIALGELFEVPRPDRRLGIVHADAVEYLAGAGAAAEVILLDGCDKGGIAAAFRNERFYRDLRARLQPGGMLVMNLIGRADRTRAHLRLLARVFGGQPLVAEVSGGGNRVAFAFNDPGFAPDWREIKRRAAELGQQYGLDFPAYARLLQRSHRSPKKIG